MAGFLAIPHLPQGGVRLCAASAYIQQPLERRGIQVVPVSPHPALAPAVADHADLLLQDLGGGRVLVAGGQPALEQALRLRGFAVEVADRQLSARYPRDIALCALALVNVLYAHPTHTARQLLDRYPLHEPVRQGYAKCSTCIVGENAVITADPAIGKAVRKHGVDVLEIRPGHVELPGYAYGFLGGCSGLLDRDLLAFTGNLDRHPDAQRIRRFCTRRGVEAVSLTDGPLVDIGGILPLIAG